MYAAEPIGSAAKVEGFMVCNRGNLLGKIAVALLCVIGATPVLAATVVANQPAGTAAGSVAAAIQAANGSGGGTVIQLVGPAATLDSLTTVVTGLRTGATVQAPSLSGVLVDVSGSSASVSAMERATTKHRLSLLLDRQSATVYVLNDLPAPAKPIATEPLAPAAPLAPAIAAARPATRPAAPTLAARTSAKTTGGATVQAKARTTAEPFTPVTAASTGYTLPAGMLLSEALDTYVKRFGWTLRWTIRDDFRLDAPVPIPPMGVIEGVSYIVKTYQSQGAMLGVVARFAKPNRVAAIENMEARDRGN